MTARGSLPPLRVLICDDNAMLRSVLADLVRSQPDLAFVAAAADRAEAVRLAARHRPDVAVLDVRFPGGGPRTAREIRHRSPATRVLAFSAYSDSGAREDMGRAGVPDYLVKGVTNTEFLAAVRRVGGRPA